MLENALECEVSYLYVLIKSKTFDPFKIETKLIEFSEFQRMNAFLPLYLIIPLNRMAT